jgi:hypothetical protein
MKERFTLTIDRTAIAHAKKFVKRNGTSLSQIVEDQFRRLGSRSFTERWRGKFKVPRPNPKDPRLTYLLRKYVHNR